MTMIGLPAPRYGDGIKKATQVKFLGYDHNLGAADGALWHMENLTGDYAPVLATRPPRYLAGTLQEPGALYGRDGLFLVDGEGFYANGEKKGTVSPGKKTFASLGPRIAIFPDKAFYHTITGEFGSLEAEWTGAAAFGDGTYAGEAAKGNTISTAGEPFPFSVNDGVTISGGPEGTEKTAIVREISEDRRELRFYENTFGETAWQGVLTLKREVPDLDFLCENENRLWGCKGDTIYASRLGDPFNWNVFDGVATDSYAVEVGSAGDFTGCCSYLGYPMFFKEDHIYKVYGSKPSNFQVMGSASLGVEKGSGKSLAVAGERLFYLSRAGMVAYGGGMPENIAHPFGGVRYHNGVGGSDGEKYYISMEDPAGERQFFVFDPRTGLWHREDNTGVLDFAWNSGLYFLTRKGELWRKEQPERFRGEKADVLGEQEKEFSSLAEFGDFTENNPNKKGMSRLQLRAELEEGARLTVSLQFDSDGIWRKAAVVKAGKKRSVVVPIVPRRCDHWRLKLEGKGGWRLYTLSREFYGGSDLFEHR